MRHHLPSPDSDSRRVALLDGVRGIAIGLVVIYDYFADYYHPSANSNPILVYLDYLFETGWSGVDLFFVLSGFLIGGILMDHRNATNYYRAFYARRVCRILPLYAIVLSPLFLAPFLTPLLPGITEFVSSGDIAAVWHLFFLQNIVMAVVGSFGERWIATTWSLAVEEQFYALAPPFVRRVRPATLVLVSLGLIAFMPILRTILLFWLPGYHSVVACYVLLRWDALLLGVLAAHLMRQPKWVSALHNNRALFTWAFVVVSAVTLAAVSYSPASGSFTMSSIGHTLISLFFSAALVYCLLFRPWFARLLELKLLCRLGLVSYAVYLFHEPVISAVFEIVFRRPRTIADSTDVALAVLALAVTLGAAACSWRYFEKPILRLGHRQPYESREAPVLLESPAPSS